MQFQHRFPGGLLLAATFAGELRLRAHQAQITVQEPDTTTSIFSAFAAIASVLCAGCSPGKAASSSERVGAQHQGSSKVLALTGATLLDGSGGSPQYDATILLHQGRIAAVGPSSQVPVPTGADELPLAGRVVAPGFIDMHYHVTTGAMRYRRTASKALDSTYDRGLAERLLRVALSMGITTIRDPGASPLAPALRLRNDVAAGRVLGPSIFTAGPIISNPKLSDAEIRAEVRTQAAAGVNYIKVYAGISPAQVRAATEEAHRRGLKIIGHLQRTSWTEAALAGMDFISHAGNWHEAYIPQERRAEYASLGGGMRARIAWLEWLEPNGAALDTMLRTLRERQVSIDPTLIAYHTKFWWRDSIYQHDPDTALVPEVLANWRVLGMHTADWSPAEFDRAHAAWPKLLALVHRLHSNGVLLTAGSDLASPWVIPGVAFHQELALLESAGISRSDVLQIATSNGARALGVADEVGTIAPGKRADLVVFDESPLENMAASRQIHYVIQAGSVYRPQDILGSF